MLLLIVLGLILLMLLVGNPGRALMYAIAALLALVAFELLRPYMH